MQVGFSAFTTVTGKDVDQSSSPAVWKKKKKRTSRPRENSSPVPRYLISRIKHESDQWCHSDNTRIGSAVVYFNLNVVDSDVVTGGFSPDNMISRPASSRDSTVSRRRCCKSARAVGPCKTQQKVVTCAVTNDSVKRLCPRRELKTCCPHDFWSSPELNDCDILPINTIGLKSTRDNVTDRNFRLLFSKSPIGAQKIQKLKVNFHFDFLTTKSTMSLHTFPRTANSRSR